jgi:hypothetical protein
MKAGFDVPILLFNMLSKTPGFSSRTPFQPLYINPADTGTAPARHI